jgi:hypothetical protein
MKVYGIAQHEPKPPVGPSSSMRGLPEKPGLVRDSRQGCEWSDRVGACARDREDNSVRTWSGVGIQDRLQ